jgi:MerR family transcriptional regulator, copper efflux regulator
MLRLNVDMKSSQTLSVGEVAETFGMPTHVLRHWESMGLLAPQRVAGDRRRYTSDDVYRVAVIRRAKQAGFSLDAIREMLDAGKRARIAIMRRHQADLRNQIAVLQASVEMLERGLNCPHEDFTTCPKFQAGLEVDIQAGKPGARGAGVAGVGVRVGGVHDH